MKVNQYIKDLIPYQSNQVDVKIRLNANETANYLFPEGVRFDYEFERYPIQTTIELETTIASRYNLKRSNVIVGNGSSELLDLIVKTFTDASDQVLSFAPSFAMYDVYCQMYGVELLKVQINEDGEMPLEPFITAIKTYQPAIVFVCNPNNPTGSILSKKDVLTIIEVAEGLVVVDEAYMEFADEAEAVIDQIGVYPNLLVARTFSKAYGLASARLGYILAQENIITEISKAKLPYSPNELSAQLGLQAFRQEGTMRSFVQQVAKERDEIFNVLKNIQVDVIPSFTNFLFVRTTIDLQSELLKYGILIRSFKDGSYRITVGSTEENKQLIMALQEVFA